MTDSPRCPQAPQSPTHHDPEWRRHPRKGMGVVRSDRWNPGTPQQGEEPRCVDGVEVHTQVPGCIVPGQGAEAGQLPCCLSWGSTPNRLSPSRSPRRMRCLCPCSQDTVCPVLPISRPNPVCSTLCPHVLGGGSNWGIPPPGAPGVTQGRHLSSWWDT